MNKIIPLIVTKDEIGSSFVINTYLNERFEAQFNRKDYKTLVITPLVTMSAGSMGSGYEAAGEYGVQHDSGESHHHGSTTGRPFEAASKYVHKGTARSLPKHMEILTNALSGGMKDFGMKEKMVPPRR